MTGSSRAILIMALIGCCGFASCTAQSPSNPVAPNSTQSNLGQSEASLSGQPVPATIANGKPVGLYYMQKYWIATRYLEKSCWYFAPDGTFYENLSTGFSPKDLEAHKWPKGTYQASAGNLEVTWSDGQSSKAELEMVPGGFNWDTGMYMPVEAFASDKPITGTYEGGSSFGSEGNSIMVSKTLNLKADGSYSMTGISSTSTTSNGTQVRAGGESEASGQWKLDGFILQLTGSDGAVTPHIAFPFDDAETPIYPDRIFVGGTMYKKQ